MRNICFLARQGLALRGSIEEDSNFIQLLKLEGEVDSWIEKWLKKKSEKYTHPEIQNECLQLMSLTILREISKNIQNSVYYTIMVDEVTDSSNKEQFVVCLRWVDHDLVTHEELVGLYAVDNITSETLVNSLKDVLLRMGLSVQNCRGQCYDGASNMVGCKSGVATQIQNKEPRAILTHCYGHSLQLAVGDMVREVRNLRDALDTTSEISKLLKYPPKRDRMFKKLKAELAPETPGFRVLCPTRWTVRAASLQSVIDNWIPLQELWDESLETNLESEVKSRVIGVKHQMGTFDYYFGVSLGAQILRISDNLSKNFAGRSYFCQRRACSFQPDN